MKTKILVGLLVVVLLLASVFPAAAQSGVSNFTHLVTTGYVQSGTYFQSGTYAKIGTFLRLTPVTEIVVTTDAVITPMGSYQPLSSAGTVQTASIATGTAGDVLTLINTANTTIVLTDTGTLKLGGNRSLGQYDTITLISDGTNWVERSFANN